ncbi:hypothetical protein [Kutzneria sp. NPDC051319]|uniref:hypothetical protein n=1 Tax=Kutzneria sp. NPDC051319 TaxID=3155047 RepID=UPI00342AB970
METTSQFPRHTVRIVARIGDDASPIVRNVIVYRPSKDIPEERSTDRQQLAMEQWLRSHGWSCPGVVHARVGSRRFGGR